MIPVVMLSLNCHHLARQAVASVLAQDVPVELMVHDQASTDGVREWLRSDHRISHLVQSPVGIGVSRAWNRCLRYWFDVRKSPATIVINNDVILRPDTARILSEDGGGFVTAVSVNNVAEMGGEYIPAPRPHPDFSCWLMRREVWDKVGEFDERFSPAYYEDNDYHIRMSKAGIRAYTCGLPFYHYGSGSMKTARYEDRMVMAEAAERNRQKFREKWGCYPATKDYEALCSIPSGKDLP